MTVSVDAVVNNDVSFELIKAYNVLLNPLHENLGKRSTTIHLETIALSRQLEIRIKSIHMMT